jgi:hypothetical protein
MTRPPATTAGFRITVRGRRIYLVDVEPTSDPGISAAEAREIAARLLACAAVVERGGSGPGRRSQGCARLSDEGAVGGGAA